MSEYIDFQSFPFLSGAHKQTIAGSLLNLTLSPPSTTHLVCLPDEDYLAMEVTTPDNWAPTNPTVIMIHGLAGSHKSPYLIRMTRKFSEMGLKVVRMNMRGCGSGRGKARKYYHGGSSEDVRLGLEALKRENPQSPLILIGYSLGGNIILKLAAELNSEGSRLIQHLIALCPPCHLQDTIRKMGQKENRFYEQYFYRFLRADVYFRHRKFRELPDVHLPYQMSLFEFDEVYTAPFHGFKNAFDYYKQCSTYENVNDIDVPTRILFAKDDPIIDPACFENASLSSHIDLYWTEHGGHLGYLGNPVGKRGIHWLDSLVIEWVDAFMKGKG